MKSDSLSMRCAFSIIMLVQISNSIIIGYPGTGGPEIWISLLISAVIVTPLMVLYAVSYTQLTLPTKRIV